MALITQLSAVPRTSCLSLALRCQLQTTQANGMGASSFQSRFSVIFWPLPGLSSLCPIPRLSTQAARLPQSICAHYCKRICFRVVWSLADSIFFQETVSLFSMAVSVFFKSPPPCVLEHRMSVAFVKEWLAAFMDWWRPLAATLTMTSQNSPGPFAHRTSIQVLVISHWNTP